jgi:hypothetical protein
LGYGLNLSGGGSEGGIIQVDLSIFVVSGGDAARGDFSVPNEGAGERFLHAG